MQPVDVGWVIVRALAVTTPMVFVEPIAVAHSPTVSWATVAFPDFRYLVAVLTVTTSGPGLTVVVVPSAASLWMYGRRQKRSACPAP